jgi:class 3 adenylate cyclase
MSVGDPSRADVRVSDAERERAVEVLRTHHADGRLTLEEFTDRVDEAYRARTESDLAHSLRELPPEVVDRSQHGRHHHHDHHQQRHQQRQRRPRRRRLPMWWIRVNGICTAVWAATTVGGGLHYFWPMWVMLGTSFPVVAAAGHGRRHEQTTDPDPAVPEQPAPVVENVTTRVVSSVLFVDVVESTQHAVAMGDREWNTVLASYQDSAREEIAACGGREVFTKGDEMVAAFATPAAAVRGGDAVRHRARALGLEVRAGVHAGEVDEHGHEMRGLAMHIGQRVCAAAQPGQLLVSSTVRDLLVGSTQEFTDIGEHELKGVPGPWRLFAVPG